MAKHSAGILLYRFTEMGLEVFLVHPGGPFWAKKDEGVWSIPKGEFDAGESPEAAARREFEEETGCRTAVELLPMSIVRQSGGKIVHAFAQKGDCDPAAIKSNTFTLEWPPHSGRQQEFPEVDRAGWFTMETAAVKILKSQVALLDELRQKLDGSGD